MENVSIHGYKDPSIPELDEETTHQLNFYAAKDIAKRSAIGPFICILGVLVSLPLSTIYDDAPGLIVAIVILLSIGALSRFYILRSVQNLSYNKLKLWKQLVSFAILSNAILWGIFLSANIYLYGLTTATLIIMLFTVAIESSAAMSIFIWQRLTQVYIVVMLLPSYIVLTMNGGIVGLSLVFGISIHMVFIYVQIAQSNKEYWKAICNNKLLENKAKELTVSKLSAEKSKEAAEKANEAKSEFLSSMSHEFRTPLNSVLGFTQLLELSATSPLTEEQRGMVDQIKHGGEHLLKLINQLLDLSKIEAGTIDVFIEAIKPYEIITESVLSLQSSADEKDVQVHVSGDSDTVIETDKTLLKQVVINLISNAIKYNRPGGKVFVEYKVVDEAMLRVTVSDTGMGIDKDKYSELFSSFNRLGKERSSIEGTGIGLTITKRIVDAMEGDTVIMTPDRFLAQNVANESKKKVVWWAGSCIVHELYKAEDLRAYREAEPDIKIIAHPECTPEVVAVADYTGSTRGIVDWVHEHKPSKVMLVTECSMATNISDELPEVEFAKPCNICPYMKKITLEKILWSLHTMGTEVVVEPEIAAKARLAVERMIDLSKSLKI